MKLLLNYIHAVFLAGILSLSAFSGCAFAVTPSSPLEMLKPTSDAMLAELKANQATLKSNPQKVFDIVNRILLPHVDMDTMAKSVVGRAEWRSATLPEQRAFTTQFTELLIRTYASALASYHNESVKFLPLRETYQNQRQIQIQSQIIQPGGPPIPVSYQLLREGNAWKVIDFSVDNVSIVQNFRAQFAGDLNQGGLSHLTQKLTQHNAELARQDTP